MKTIFTVFTFVAFTFLGTTLSAQNYQSAVGVRLGDPLAASYKFFISETSAIELTGAFSPHNGYTLMGVGGTYQFHNDLSASVEGLQWFYGGGGTLYYTRWSSEYSSGGSSQFTLHGSLGLDYRFADAPVNASLDWQPTFFLNGGGFYGGYGALSVRYILGE